MDGSKIPNASVWMQNIQLAFVCVIIAAFQGGLKETGKQYLHGFGGPGYLAIWWGHAGGSHPTEDPALRV